MMNKKIFTVLIVALMFFVLSLPVSAQSLAVIDEADVFSNEQELILTAQIENIRNEYDFDITLITTADTGGQYIEDYADYHPGVDKSRNVIIFAMDLQNRDYFTIDTTGGSVITDAALSKIEDDIVPLLSDGDYFSAFSNYVSLADMFLSAAYSGEPYAGDPLDAGDIGLALLIGLGGGIAVAFAVTAAMIAKMNTARKKNEAASYVRQGSFILGQSHDRFLYENTTRTAIPKKSSSGGSSSGGRGGGKF